MDGEQISLLAVYDKVAGLDGKVGALIARVEERLENGSRKMDDHESRLRVLEASREQGRGKAGVMTVVLSLAGSSSASALISFLLARR